MCGSTRRNTTSRCSLCTSWVIRASAASRVPRFPSILKTRDRGAGRARSSSAGFIFKLSNSSTSNSQFPTPKRRTSTSWRLGVGYSIILGVRASVSERADSPSASGSLQFVSEALPAGVAPTPETSSPQQFRPSICESLGSRCSLRASRPASSRPLPVPAATPPVWPLRRWLRGATHRNLSTAALWRGPSPRPATRDRSGEQPLAVREELAVREAGGVPEKFLPIQVAGVREELAAREAQGVPETVLPMQVAGVREEAAAREAPGVPETVLPIQAAAALEVRELLVRLGQREERAPQSATTAALVAAEARARPG